MEKEEYPPKLRVISLRLNKGGHSSWNGYRAAETYILPDLGGSNCVAYKGT